MQIKKERLESIILRNTSMILQNEVRNPDIGFVTVTDVKLTNDYSFAKIYVTFLDNQNHHKNHMEALEKVKGVVRSKLSRTLDIRKTPELIFVYDESLQTGNRIEQIINDLKKEDTNR